MKATAVILIISSAGWFLSCGGEHPTSEAAKLPPVPVKVATAAEVEWPAIYEAAGTVRAHTAATLSAKVMGVVEDFRVDAGDRVKAGQVLVTLDARDLEAGYRRASAGLAEASSAMVEVNSAIAAAKAQLDLAEATFKRMEDLHDKRSISDQEFDQVTAKRQMARANYKMAESKKQQLADKTQQAEEAVATAKIMRGYAKIKAPFDGIVTAKMADRGDLASPGVPLVRIEKAGRYHLEAALDESLLSEIRVGQRITADLGALERKLEARITEVVPAVDSRSRAFVVKAELPNLPNLRSGLFGRVRIETAARKVVTAPVQAIVKRGQVEAVFVVDDGRVRARLVTVGERRKDQVEILSGLVAGEQLVAPIPPNLRDGSPVEVQR